MSTSSTATGDDPQTGAAGLPPEFSIETADVETNSAERIVHNDTEHIVAEVTAARAMRLNGGYVPGEEFRDSVPQWEHVPLPIGHPVNPNGDYISARVPEVIDQTVVGYFQNVAYDDAADALTGEVWVNVEKAQALGEYGQRIVEILENGDPLEVSTAYRADHGVPGVYDGEFREPVRTNIRPDHLALLPDDLGPGKCSVEDGCGVNPDAADDDEPAETAAANVDTDHEPVSRPFAGIEVDVDAERVYLNTTHLANDVSIHTPSYSGTTESGEWSRPAQSDFDTDDLSEIDDHFIASRSGFPPENYGDLVLPVVSASGNLSLPGLRAAASRVSQVDGLSDDEQSRIESMIERLANDEFDADFGDSEDSESNENVVDDDTTPDADDPRTLAHRLLESAQALLSGADTDVNTDPDTPAIETDVDDAPDACAACDGDDPSPTPTSTDDSTDTPTDAGEVDDSHTTDMTDLHDEIASHTDFTADDLADLDDEFVEALANELLNDCDCNGDECGCNDDGEANEADADADAGTADVEDTPDINTDEFATQEQLASLQQDVNELKGVKETVEELAATLNEEEQTKREELKEDITSNTDRFTDEELDEMSTETLEKTADLVTPDEPEPAVNADPAPRASGTDLSALRPTKTVSNDDGIDEDDLPSSGSLAEYRKRNAGD